MTEPRVVIEMFGNIKNSRLSVVNRYCKIFGISQSYGYWKGLTVEVRELFIREQRVGKMSIFR